MQHKKPRSERAVEALPAADRCAENQAAGSHPLYFGPPERPLFGWLHLPAKAHGLAVGLVICNPFGNEAVCAQRSIRHFAEEACQVGYPVLRFDYDGTGDSAGHDQGPERVTAWLDSVHAAADELKRAAGVDRLYLFGIRLGATLAATAAADRDDIEGLIAVAPVVSGKAYVRELRLLSRAIDAKRSLVRAADEDGLEAAGFVLSQQTQASLNTLDLTRLESFPVARVLVLDRTEMPSDQKWTQRLSERGVHVDRTSVRGYTEMMLDSHETVVPWEMIQTTCRWLSESARQFQTHGRGQAASGAPATEPAADVNLLCEATPDPVTGPGPDIEVREHAVRFGNPTLFGIISAPSASARAAARAGEGVLLLNSGAVHRIGPNRLYVSLARHLARHGYTVLRLDITGLGDSPPRPGADENVVYSAHALQDARAALEYLRDKWGITRVHATGLCSGAYNAFKAAVAHLPLAGAILINPLTFFWKEGMSLEVTEYTEHRIANDMQRYRTNVWRLDSWLKLLRGNVDLVQLSKVLTRRMRTVALAPLRSVARALGIALQDDLPSELRSVARAGIQLNFVFADRDPGRELLNTLGGSTARRLIDNGAIRVQTIAGADHTFTDRAARAQLVATVLELLTPTGPALEATPAAEPQHAV